MWMVPYAYVFTSSEGNNFSRIPLWAVSGTACLLLRHGCRKRSESLLNRNLHTSDMHTSTVKWFDADKGYGFIHHPEDGDDVFVHYSNIQSEDDFKTLKSEQQVRFEMNEGPKGLHALEVEPFSADAEQEKNDPSEDEPERESFDLSDLDPTAKVDPSLS